MYRSVYYEMVTSTVIDIEPTKNWVWNNLPIFYDS